MTSVSIADRIDTSKERISGDFVQVFGLDRPIPLG